MILRSIASVGIAICALGSGCMIIGHHHATRAEGTAWLLPAPNHELQLAVVLVTTGRAGNPHQPFDFPRSFRDEEVHWFRLRSVGPVIYADEISHSGEMAQEGLGSSVPAFPVKGSITLTCASAVLDLALPVYDAKYVGSNYPPILGWKPYEFNGTYSLRFPNGVSFKTNVEGGNCRLAIS